MTDQDRGSLFVRKERVEAQIAATRKVLTGNADVLRRLVSALSAPENVVFSNAPDGLGNIPGELLGAPALEWAETSRALDLREIAAQIQGLRAATFELTQINQQLGRR